MVSYFRLWLSSFTGEIFGSTECSGLFSCAECIALSFYFSAVFGLTFSEVDFWSSYEWIAPIPDVCSYGFFYIFAGDVPSFWTGIGTPRS
jgi:hypothetical protein